MHDIYSDSDAAYSQERAWHGLGYVFPGEMTLEDAWSNVNLDWEVTKEPTYYKAGFTMQGDSEVVNWQQIEDRVVLVRSDNLNALGYMSPAYEAFQNSELRELVREVLEYDEGAYVESCMVLGGGKDIVIQVKLRDWAIGNDKNCDYLVIRNSHDGTSALQMFFTNIRVVCRNTFTWALNGAVGRFSIKHTARMRDRVETAKAAIRDARESGAIYEDFAKTLNGWNLSESSFGGLVSDTLDILVSPLPDQFEDADKFSRVFNKRQKVQEEILYNNYGALPEASGTAWDLFNKTTGWLDHMSQTRNATVDSVSARRLFPDSLTNKRKEKVTKLYEAGLSA